jgi:hypothetical protein
MRGAASCRHCSSGTPRFSPSRTCTATWSAPASRCSPIRATIVSASPHTTRASTKVSLPPGGERSSSLKPSSDVVYVVGLCQVGAGVGPADDARQVRVDIHEGRWTVGNLSSGTNLVMGEGIYAGSEYLYDGQLDDVMLCSYALTPEQIKVYIARTPPSGSGHRRGAHSETCARNRPAATITEFSCNEGWSLRGRAVGKLLGGSIASRRERPMHALHPQARDNHFHRRSWSIRLLDGPTG